MISGYKVTNFFPKSFALLAYISYLCAHYYANFKTTELFMNNDHLIMNANPIVTFLGKQSAEFTKADIINYFLRNLFLEGLKHLVPLTVGRL